MKILVNNENKDLEILKSYGFKRKTEWGNSGNYKYHIYTNSELKVTFVYNVMVDIDKPYIEVWYGKYMENYDTMDGLSTVDECIELISELKRK